MSQVARTRADRLRLANRIELAARASALLSSKEEALDRERVRMEGHATRSAAEWERCLGTATRRLVRARMLGASEEIAELIETGGPRAQAATSWHRTMGVAHPGDVEVHPAMARTLSTTAALRPAADAYREALVAGARHAAIRESLRLLSAELDDTRRRRRAIDHRLRPRLERARHELDLRLDELDRDEALRVRLAADAGARS